MRQNASPTTYSVIYFVGTGVPDCPFRYKCYFMTERVAEDVDPYKTREDATFALQTCYAVDILPYKEQTFRSDIFSKRSCNFSTFVI